MVEKEAAAGVLMRAAVGGQGASWGLAKGEGVAFSSRSQIGIMQK